MRKTTNSIFYIFLLFFRCFFSWRNDETVWLQDFAKTISDADEQQLEQFLFTEKWCDFRDLSQQDQ